MSMASPEPSSDGRDDFQIFEIRLAISYCNGVLAQWRPQP